MPAVDQVSPTSLATRIKVHLVINGPTKTAALAAALEPPDDFVPNPNVYGGSIKSNWTIHVGRECSRMFAKGMLARPSRGVYSMPRA